MFKHNVKTVKVYPCDICSISDDVSCFVQGGMKAVVWTDVFQAVIMIAGLLAIVIQVV